MSQVTPSAQDEQQFALALVEFSVVLLANQTDPSILNPDFLRHRKVVDETLELKSRPVSMPVFSQVEFTNGIVIRAETNRFVFEQKVSRAGQDEFEVAEIARRFIDVVGFPMYSAVGINPRAIVYSGDGASGISDALLDSGKWLSFKDVTPDIQLKAAYNFERKRISMEVGGVVLEGESNDLRQGLFIEANFHRDLSGNDGVERASEAQAILSGYGEDIADFRKLVRKFEFLGIMGIGS